MTLYLIGKIVTNLETLLETMYQTAEKRSTETFHSQWLEVMDKFDYHIVERAWLRMRVSDRWKWFDLKWWAEFCLEFEKEEVQREKTAEEKKNKPSYAERDQDMKAWTENHSNFSKCLMTYGEYLAESLKIGQMSQQEADYHRNLYKNRGDKSTDYPSRGGLEIEL